MSDIEHPRILHGQPSFRDGDNRRGLVIDTPYNADFVEQFKAQIPSRDRAWDPDEQQWWCAVEWSEMAAKLVAYHYGAHEIVDEHGCIEYHDADGTVARQEEIF